MENTPPKLPIVDSPLPAETERKAEITEQSPRPSRLEPTRYGDWELNGKCVDF